MSLAVKTVQLAACGTHRVCKAPVARNDSIRGPEYREGLIRYPWKFFESYAITLEMEPTSVAFSHFLLGVMAHEYGHFLDGYGRVPAYWGMKERFPEVSESLLPELWADFTAGCVLGSLESPTDAFVQALTITASCGHPPPDLRKQALAFGFSECNPDRRSMPEALAAHLTQGQQP